MDTEGNKRSEEERHRLVEAARSVRMPGSLRGGKRRKRQKDKRIRARALCVPLAPRGGGVADCFPFADLPVEIQGEIAAYLPHRDKHNLGSVDKARSTLVRNIWERQARVNIVSPCSDRHVHIAQMVTDPSNWELISPKRSLKHGASTPVPNPGHEVVYLGHLPKDIFDSLADRVALTPEEQADFSGWGTTTMYYFPLNLTSYWFCGHVIRYESEQPRDDWGFSAWRLGNPRILYPWPREIFRFDFIF